MGVPGVLDEIIKPGDCTLAFGIPLSQDEFMADCESEDKDFFKTFDVWKCYEHLFISHFREIEPVLLDLGVTVIHRLTLNDFGHLFKNSKAKIIILFTHWKEEKNHTCFKQQDYLEFLERHPAFLETVQHSRELLEWLLVNCNRLKSLIKVKLSKRKKGKPKSLVEIKGGEIHANYKEIVRRYLKEIEVETYVELLRNTFTSKVEFYDGLKGLYDIIQQVPANFHGLLDLTVCRCQDLTTALKKCRPHCYFKYKIDMFEEKNGDKVLADMMLHFYKILFKHLNRTQLTYFEAYREVIEGFSERLLQLDNGKNFIENQ
jgi:hypothetical protein